MLFDVFDDFQCFFLRPGNTVHCVCGFSLAQNPGQNPGQNGFTGISLGKIVRKILRKLHKKHATLLQKTSLKLFPSKNVENYKKKR